LGDRRLSPSWVVEAAKGLKAMILKAERGLLVWWSTLEDVRQGYKSILRPEGKSVDRFTSVLLPPLGYRVVDLKLLLFFFFEFPKT
jgi:hypothetical protein